MNGTKFMGIVLGLAGVILLAGGIYFAITYVGSILTAMVDFVTANSNAISRCGITVPEEVSALKGDITTTILPAVYLGIPLAVILISAIMFAGGYFFGKGSYQDQLNKQKKQEEQVEEEVERRTTRKKKSKKKSDEEEE